MELVFHPKLGRIAFSFYLVFCPTLIALLFVLVSFAKNAFSPPCYHSLMLNYKILASIADDDATTPSLKHHSFSASFYQIYHSSTSSPIRSVFLPLPLPVKSIACTLSFFLLFLLLLILLLPS